jgi:hypothetical protein
MASAAQNKAGLRAWTTPEQKAWFTSKLPSYIASRSSDSKTDFWPPIFEEWFEKWPVVPPATETAQDAGAEAPKSGARVAEEVHEKKKVNNGSIIATLA